ncbi:RusA family crossover junction endodeoxyribonuclease [Nitratireductor sp. CH_MIT9313-5]|uniref:RusA family crossover junction endodeoxyribonuclease n=1 Tax=Nitratireductor sp. CH_MIT9313-5 TaxID=3107764 RepID=UPI0030087A44
MIRISLPYPPSINAAYANGGNKRGRHKTAAYRAWEQLAGTCIKDAHRQALGPYSLHIAARRPDKRRRDLGNIEKVVSDLLVTHGVVKDDCLAERITLQWDAGLDAECVVIVQPAEEAMAA